MPHTDPTGRIAGARHTVKTGENWRPAIFGDRDPPRSLVEHAGKIGADLMLLGRDFRYEAGERQWDFIGRKGTKRALPMPALRGQWQLKNASSALAALDELADRLPVSLGEVKRPVR